MAVNIGRFYGRKKWEFECEIVTPMFLGNADQNAELRAAPFKGMLRYWWRIANGRNYGANEHERLLAAENRVFGSPDDAHGGKSRVSIRVELLSGMKPAKTEFPKPRNVHHPECEKTGNNTNPLNYLAGMGLIHYKKGVQHSYFPGGAQFELVVESARDVAGQVEDALALFTGFAAIGSRCRNGWGCFSVNSKLPLHTPLVDWETAMDRDYPNCLGKDNRGALLWRTKTAHDDWTKCMRDLAETYIKVRTDLNVVSGNSPDRHLLGYPVTNHNYWGRQKRHASALRLMVKKETRKYRGYFLHLPHLFSYRLGHYQRERQVEIWEKVHNTLDQLCDRSKNGEVRS